LIEHALRQELAKISATSTRGAQRSTIMIASSNLQYHAQLTSILRNTYDLFVAENGIEARQLIRANGSDISLILLDFAMPKMNGFELLSAMRDTCTDAIPVIMITTDNRAEFIQRALDLGVSDFIAPPFNASIVRQRIKNALSLMQHQNTLISMVVDQMYERQHETNSMVTILSHIVEFRNGESGPHVQNVRTITELLLLEYMNRTPDSGLTGDDIIQIGMASSLHDIGKISIPEEILNKPGRLTPEEFEIMKTHSSIGAQMLADLPELKDERLLKHAYDICRWHHERYDGSGYPDGIAGDKIPLSAQVVAVADVYDALTSDRVYKAAIPHERAVEMILDGECGAMNPRLLECFSAIESTLPDMLHDPTGPSGVPMLEKNIITQMISESSTEYGSGVGKNISKKLMNYEHVKHRFMASMASEIQYEYSENPSLVVITEYGQDKLGLPSIIRNPYRNDTLVKLIGADGVNTFVQKLHAATYENPETSFEIQTNFNGKKRWFKVHARTMWSTDDPTVYVGSIGKAIDITDTRREMDNLQHKASYDSLTGTLNHAQARKEITDRLAASDKNYVLIMTDLDFFKEANDQRGHMFGDRLLKHFAAILRSNVRENDIVARFGGDEFLLCIEAGQDFTPIVNRIFNALSSDFEGYRLNASMGVSCTHCCGRDYDRLLAHADEALYLAKRSGRGTLSFCHTGGGGNCAHIQSRKHLCAV
jgi:putative two-component system response regulator